MKFNTIFCDEFKRRIKQYFLETYCKEVDDSEIIFKVFLENAGGRHASAIAYVSSQNDCHCAIDYDLDSGICTMEFYEMVDLRKWYTN